MNRRQFIRAGVAGGAVLTAGGAWMVWRDRDPANPDAVAIERGHRIDRIIGSIAPAILAGILPAGTADRNTAIKRVATDVGLVVANFTPPVRKEVHELFALLDVGIARRLLTGVSRDWPDADADEVAAFLERWRRSSFATLQSGYHALHDLVLGAWYANPATWPRIGYPGPPNIQ